MNRRKGKDSPHCFHQCEQVGTDLVFRIRSYLSTHIRVFPLQVEIA
jgi:hypothetical protein